MKSLGQSSDVLIRLTGDGTGFIYKVKHGWFRLPSRRISLFGDDESVVPDEVRMFETAKLIETMCAVKSRDTRQSRMTAPVAKT